MSYFDSLREIQGELNKCMKCGNCQAVCPLYKELKSEAVVARGKISLIEAVLDKYLIITEGFKRRMDMCLMCKACTANCPSGVKVDAIIMAARVAATREKGLSLVKRVVFSALSRPRLFEVGIKTGKHFQGLAFKRLPERNGGHPRFPIGLGRRRVVPLLARKPLKDELPQLCKVTKPKMTVAFFMGCTINYIYTDIGKSVVSVLNKNNIDVNIPYSQHCCGTPIFTSGDIDTAREMAKSNIDILLNANADAIITACATCGGALKREYPMLLSEDRNGYAEKARKLSEKVYDIAQFLVDVIDFKTVKMHPVDRRVTYHDPCHLNRTLGVYRQPREIIMSIPGVEWREMNNPDRCCGGAGSFSLTHYDISMTVHRHKAEDIRGTGADTVLTGCPACRMQLEDGIKRYGLSQDVMHTVELLNMSYMGKY